MSNETIPVVPLPEGMTRMESGPVQFGTEDWPGYFLRGDVAPKLLTALEACVKALTALGFCDCWGDEKCAHCVGAALLGEVQNAN